eukprot:gene231-4477_t
MSSKQTLVEKIVQKFVKESKPVFSGDYVTIQPKHCLTHDNTAAVINKFKTLSVTKVKNPKQPVFVLDHNVQDKSEMNLKKYKNIENFAKEHSVNFYNAGRGIGHQVMCEEGYAWPLSVVVASDSHSNMYGGIGCLGTPIVRTDAASIWATGETWWQIPKIAKVEFVGKLQPGVTGKDVIITLCGLYNSDEVLNHAIEFTGEGVNTLSIDDRLTIANMTTEWGALVGLFPCDSNTLNWLEYQKSKNITIESILNLEKNNFKSDEGSFYSKHITLDLSLVSPYISGPNHVKIMQSANEIQKKKIEIQKAYIVSCVNSRTSDLEEASKILKGKKISKNVELYISAASSNVLKECEDSGVWKDLLDSGATPLTPGCGPCIGLGTGLLEDGEVGISATNRNFKGRMGSRNAEVYLSSPGVVAESALNGYIKSPYSVEDSLLKKQIKENKQQKNISSVELTEGFPKEIEGDFIFCYQDNLNTDGIYPGKYTYNENITLEEQAKVCMENYDTEFVNLTKEGDILVSGYNFGTGSSREQAATSLKAKGIQCLFAGSFSETYKRNAINNGFLVIEVPELVNYFKEKFGQSKLTVQTKFKAKINFEKSNVIVITDKNEELEFSFSPD